MPLDQCIRHCLTTYEYPNYARLTGSLQITHFFLGRLDFASLSSRLTFTTNALHFVTVHHDVSGVQADSDNAEVRLGQDWAFV